jgi:hypothetical protein
MILPRFVLTPEEKKALIFIVAALALGLGTMRYRETHRHNAASEAQPHVKAKRSPVDNGE